MTLEELTIKMDAAFHYPGERFIEPWLPGLDRWIDRILYTLLTVEEVATEQGMKPEREQMAVDMLLTFWKAIPMPIFIKQWLGGFIEPIIRQLIRQAVAWLNATIGHKWPKASVELAK